MSRVLLKLSGEALGGSQGFGFDSKILQFLSLEISRLIAVGHSVGLVLGGGNLVRGSGFAELSDDRVVGDHMGMLATIMNALALSSFLNRNQVVNKVFSALGIAGVAKDYDKNDALEVLSSGSVGIFAGGTGNPFFTTDSAAVLRAIEINADVILKGTRVDGIYNKDPEKNKEATKFDSLSFEEVLKKGLKVMDTTAFTLSQENNLPIIVFDMNIKGNLSRIINGDKIGTRVDL